MPSKVHSWITLAVAVLALLYAVTGSNAAEPDTRCFELRIYTANPGKLADLNARFRNHTVRLFEKHGMTNIGYWEPVENPEQKLVYLLAYPSKEAREESWKKFQDDPDWKKAKGDSEANGALVGKVVSKFMQPTDFSPTVKVGTDTAKRIFELRTYVSSPGNLERLLHRARDHTEWLLNAYNITGLGYWTMLPNQPGADSSLIYLLAHPSVQAGEEAFRKMRADPMWKKIKEESEREAGGPLTLGQDGIISLYMRATDYSPMK